MNMARPAAPIAAALRVAPSMSMSPSTTSAPAVAKARAIAFPRPVAEPEPVTNATLPTSVTHDILCVVSGSLANREIQGSSAPEPNLIQASKPSVARHQTPEQCEIPKLVRPLDLGKLGSSSLCLPTQSA